MTFADLLDNVAEDAGDKSGEFRSRVLRWLNVDVRGYIALKASWSGPLRVDESFVTSAARTTGNYPLRSSAGENFEEIRDNYLYDETNNCIIVHESLQRIHTYDEDKDETGTPRYWADAGRDSNGNRLVYLWPIPDGSYTIRLSGRVRLADITENDEGLQNDSYFGPLAVWGSTFSAGLRWRYHDHNNESETQIGQSFQIFERMISAMRKKNSVAPSATLRLDNLRSGRRYPASGRFPDEITT